MSGDDRSTPMTGGTAGAPAAVNDWRACPAVERDAAGRVWVFRGSQVPIAALFEFLEDGEALSDFLEWFPDLPVEQVRAVLEHAGFSV